MGADLVLVSRTERRLEKMAEVVRAHGRRALVVPTDITDEDSRVALVERAVEEFGKVDCLINNAFGIPPMDPISTIKIEDLRAANETNVFAPLRLSALFADALAASHGSIIMLNSCVVFSSQPEYSGYKLSKGALEHLASSLATELGPRGIRVNSRRAVLHLRGRQQGVLRLAGLRGRRHPRRHLRREGRARPTSSGWPRPRRSPGPRCSSPPTWPPRSPARCSPSTAASSTTDAMSRQRDGPRARGRRRLRGHRRGGRAHHRAVRLRRHARTRRGCGSWSRTSPRPRPG